MLKIEDVDFAYDDSPVLHSVSLNVQATEIICLLGPSGCGKTTLLRIIAGLEAGYGGRIIFDGQDMAKIPVNTRDFGLMFQEFALFPHLSVADNIAYGLKRRGISEQARKQQVNKLLDRVGLAGFGHRDVNLLSGGQKQRVALARSIAPNPRLLMLDEPLGALDALLRDQLTVELRHVIKSIGLTAIYVTHDQLEAFAISDRVVIMNEGQIVQIDTPQVLYERPKTIFVARFLGLTNIYSRDELMSFEDARLRELLSNISTSHLLIHPGGIDVKPLVYKASENEYHGKLEMVIFRGDYQRLEIRLNSGLLLSTTSRDLSLSARDDVIVIIDPSRVIPLIS